jgi:hypothetical protein
MPKYFNDERPLLYPKTTLGEGDLEPNAIAKRFNDRKEHSLCLSFSGFEPNCLGFVIHVRKTADRYELLNIAGEIEMTVRNEQQLVEVIRHISGLEYSAKVQRAFQEIRNDIGSGIPLDAFADTI